METGDSPQKTITIVVKTPNQLQEDQTVNGVNVNWTIKDLKTHLSTVYPTKPVGFGPRNWVLLLLCNKRYGISGMFWNVIT